MKEERAFKWLIGVIGLLLVLGLAGLLMGVLLYRAAPIRRHPPASPHPRATATYFLLGEWWCGENETSLMR